MSVTVLKWKQKQIQWNFYIFWKFCLAINLKMILKKGKMNRLRSWRINAIACLYHTDKIDREAD